MVKFVDELVQGHVSIQQVLSESTIRKKKVSHRKRDYALSGSHCAPSVDRDADRARSSPPFFRRVLVHD